MRSLGGVQSVIDLLLLYRLIAASRVGIAFVLVSSEPPLRRRVCQVSRSCYVLVDKVLCNFEILPIQLKLHPSNKARKRHPRTSLVNIQRLDTLPKTHGLALLGLQLVQQSDQVKR